MTTLRKALLLCALLGGMLLVAKAAAAQQGTPPAPVTDDDVNRVAKQLYCPVCENVPLDVCPTQACAQWRATIREKLQGGWSDQQIFDYFVEQYGERVLAKPSTKGLNILLWVLPPVLVVAGAVVVYTFIRGSQRHVAAVAPPAPDAPSVDPFAPPDEYAVRLEQELRKRI